MPSKSLAPLAAPSLTLALATSAPAQSPEVTRDPTSLLWGRQFTEWFYAGDVDSIFTRMDADNQKETGSPTEMLKLLSEAQQQGGWRPT